MGNRKGYGRTKEAMAVRHKKMERMYKAGMSVSEISRALGYDGNSTVYRYLSGAGFMDVQLSFYQCQACGKLFIPIQHGVRDRNASHPMYCSKKCSREVSRKKSNAKRREIIDASTDAISLSALYRRDQGICYLCGEKCDYKDRRIASDGKTIICGEQYPSIDHIVPLSRGGSHTWENVKLAHRGCNSAKSIKEQPKRGTHEGGTMENKD